MRKVTFTLDEETLRCLADAAERLRIPKSAVLREAIRDYRERIDRLTERERVNLLKVLDTLLPQIPPRSRSAVKREIRKVREARVVGGRRYGGAHL